MGVTFISNKNKAITFEVNIQHAFAIAAVDDLGEQVRRDYNLCVGRELCRHFPVQNSNSLAFIPTQQSLSGM